jgi:hypothetical protein
VFVRVQMRHVGVVRGLANNGGLATRLASTKLILDGDCKHAAGMEMTGFEASQGY